MADGDWRNLERQWQASPGDQDLLQRALAARLRAGVPVSRRLLDGVVKPACEFNSREPLEVWALLPHGRVEKIGQTPRWLGRPLRIPEHRRWWVRLPSPLRDARLARLAEHAAARKIPGLELDARNLTDAGLVHLRGLDRLETLIVKSGRHVTDAGIAHLGGLVALENLYLWGCSAVGDAGVEHLSGLTRLTSLQLPGSQLSDVGARVLGSLARLTELGLTGCRIGDQGLRELGGLRGLAALDLDQCRGVSDAGLEHLADLGQLVKLNLFGCDRVTDAGMQPLSQLESLGLLIVPPLRGDEGVSDSGIEVIRRANPRCVVRQTWDPHAWQHYPWDV